METDERFQVVLKEGRSLRFGQRLVLVDRETGVNYLYVRSGYSGGLSPLLDAEGKPIVTPRDQF